MNIVCLIEGIGENQGKFPDMKLFNILFIETDSLV
jgi:hypothetical protein